MLGSAISKRWVVSLALVGLVSLFMASHGAMWSGSASAGTTTVAGLTLDSLSVNLGPNGGSATYAPSSELSGTVQVLNAGGADITSTAPALTYAWSASNHCATFSSSTSSNTNINFIGSGCSGVITLTVDQPNNVPAAVVWTQNVTVNSPSPAPTAAAPAVDGALLISDADLQVLSDQSTDYGAGNIVPSKSALIEAGEGSSISISAGSLDSGDSKVVSIQTISVADLAAPPPMQESGSTSGTFKFGSSAISISFFNGSDIDGDEDKVSLNKPAQVCMTYTQADLDGAYRGPEGLKIQHWNGTAWVALNTTVFTNPNRACAYTSSFSPFVLGLDVAPSSEAPSAPTGLPATGDYTPGVSGLILALMAGFALVGGGLFTARRARRVRENS